MAKFFQVSYTCSALGDIGGMSGCTYRRDGDPGMVGNLEPIIMTGSVGATGALDPSFGTYDLVEWGTITANPVPDRNIRLDVSQLCIRWHGLGSLP